jgi:hypothetical protein
VFSRRREDSSRSATARPLPKLDMQMKPKTRVTTCKRARVRHAVLVLPESHSAECALIRRVRENGDTVGNEYGAPGSFLDRRTADHVVGEHAMRQYAPA